LKNSIREEIEVYTTEEKLNEFYSKGFWTRKTFFVQPRFNQEEACLDCESVSFDTVVYK